MAEEKDMADKILRMIENIISSDSELQDFIIIPTEDNIRNKSPILYEQHNIGLESWCIKHVYQYACAILFGQRELLSRAKKIYCKMENLNYLLIGTILINPQVGTFWNMRRELVELDVLNTEKELHFSYRVLYKAMTCPTWIISASAFTLLTDTLFNKIVLSHKSKSNEAFSYRRWLLKRILNKLIGNDLQTPLTFLQTEFMVTDMASQKSANNYHSWTHRIWCMENIALNSPNLGNIVYSELSYSQQWINTHVSEHAGYHYRQYLIKLVKEQKNMGSSFESFYNFVTKHLNLINDGEYSNLLIYLLGKQSKTRLLEEICSYINYISLLLYDLFTLIDKLDKLFPEHESLFYHRRFVVFHLLKLVYEYHGIEFRIRIENVISTINCKNIVNIDVMNLNGSRSMNECNHWPKLFKSPLNKIQAGNLYKIIINSEKHYVFRNLGNNCSEVQSELTKRYHNWIKYIIGLE